MIDRNIEPILVGLANAYPVVTLTGPRQSGKTTLCRKVFPAKHYANLESPDVRRFAMDDPRGFLASFPDGGVLDEIQRVPDLLSYIQVIVDERNTPNQYILTGSQQFEIMNTISQSLAGRTALLKLLPLTISELEPTYLPESVDRLILNGFYPRVYDQGLDPTRAMGDYFETYVQRDLRQLISLKDIGLFEKFVRLCAGRVGQILNLQSLGNDVGVSHSTIRSWITLLEASYIVFLLQPWHANISKRLIKSPKLYFYDVGLAAFLLGLETESHVSRDPLRGNLFENMVVIEALKYRYNLGKRSNLFFYRSSNGNEVDLIMESGRDVIAIEIKAGETINPDFFKGLRNFKKALGDQRRIYSGILYGGNEVQRRSDAAIYPAVKCRDLFDQFLAANEHSPL
ncbi:MAG: ATP-binding protein [Pseudomonadota bacterium]